MISAMKIEEMTFRSEGVDCAARIYRPDVAPEALVHVPEELL